jgi:hypothetical protein
MKPIVFLLIVLVSHAAYAQVGQITETFDTNTGTLTLPSVAVGAATYSVVMHYDADGRMSITSIQPAAPSIVGSWYPDPSKNAIPAGLMLVFTFFADGTYVLADNGNTTAADPNGQPGIEVGSYTYNPASGAFSTSCPRINSNGEWGLSHGRQGGVQGCSGTGGVVTIRGNAMALAVEVPGEPTSILHLTR